MRISSNFNFYQFVLKLQSFFQTRCILLILNPYVKNNGGEMLFAQLVGGNIIGKYNPRHDVHRFKNEWFIFSALKYRINAKRERNDRVSRVGSAVRTRTCTFVWNSSVRRAKIDDIPCQLSPFSSCNPTDGDSHFSLPSVRTSWARFCAFASIYRMLQQCHYWPSTCESLLF